MFYWKRTFMIVLALGAAVCSPYMAPTTVPPARPEQQTVEPFRAALQAYVDQTQPYRKQAAQAAESVPGKAAPTPAAETAVRTRQNVLADALRTKLRPAAKQGDLFVSPAASTIHHDLDQAFAGLRHDLLMDALAEQNDTGKASVAPAHAVISFRESSRSSTSGSGPQRFPSLARRCSLVE